MSNVYLKNLCLNIYHLLKFFQVTFNRQYSSFLLSQFSFDDVFSDQQLFKTTICVHLLQNITTSNKLTFYINLRNSRPIWVRFYGFSQILIFKYIYIFVLFDTIKFEDLNNIIWKSASWHFSWSFHKYT